MTIPCQRCGLPAPDGALTCPSCGGFVFEREMTDLSHRARSFEALGKRAEALADWKRILTLLPPGASQRALIEQEVRKLEGTAALPPAGPTPITPGRVGGAGAVIALVLSKAKLLLLGLGKMKTVLSMIIMAAVYTRFYGWQFAVGIVLLIYVHEMGHVLAIRSRGLEASWPVFVPFVGAFVRLKTNPRTPAEDAYIGYAGPLFGSIAAGVVWVGALALQSKVLLALAFFGFYINFFNLIAIPPLDGGRVTNALGKVEWLVAIPLLWLGVWWNPEGLVMIIAFIATARGLAVAFRKGAPAVVKLPDRERFAAAAAYVLLALALIASMKASHPGAAPEDKPGTIATRLSGPRPS